MCESKKDRAYMIKPVQEILNKQLLRRKPTGEQFTAFTEALRELKESIRPDESEEYNKNHVQQFLADAFYGKTNLINTAGPIDCAIYQAKDSKSPIEVMIEAKSPSNTSEFPAHGNLNCKAMQELVLYFMRQRFREKNITLKHLIITNGYEWYIFDAVEFEKYFADDNKFVKKYDDWDNGRTLFSNTKDFYADIAKPKIDQVKQQITCVYIDIRLLKTENEKLRLFRILQPAHLLKQFKFADSNKLNTAFYNELLHIIGLEEHLKKGKSVIERKEELHRDEYSLLENTIYQLEDYNLSEEETFNIALNLVITWINRILFLKLLESQLISYHGQKNADQYRFLSIHIIKNFDELNELFFKVLALPLEQRPHQVKDKYRHVPYLNSSLFELTSNESSYFRITGLKPGEMPLYPRTVLKDINGHMIKPQMDTLEYLFRFMEAYDFGSEQNDDITQTENKTLINASVLGLIFEKINGYKDGSFFTPGFITQYMCREAIDRTVINKFNEHFGFSCQTLTDIHNQDFDKQEATKLIDDITLCDPAVGSGHFLVSALNYLIVVRAEFGLLYDENGKRLKDYSFSIDNDELIVTDEEGEIFHYNPNNLESQRVQKTLFDLKRQIIENNLFGVDINPNSVNICRLRLWIELLKNAYYKESKELETLPNIDINIKCGNSLISHYPVRVGFYGGFNDNQLRAYIEAYKKAVREYKVLSNKEQKKVVAEKIQFIKSKLLKPTSQLNLFEQKQEVSKKEQLLQNANPLEWMIEFPEVLDDEGVFKGFDIVIGNPPYIVSSDKIYKDYVTYNCHELYAYFFELAIKLLRDNGILSFITASLYVKGLKFESLRTLLENHLILIEYKRQGDDIFENVNMPTATLIGLKGEGSWSCSLLNPLANLASKIAYNQKKLYQISQIHRGLEIGREDVTEHGDYSCITGTAVSKFVTHTIRYISKETLALHSKDEKYFSNERILLRETGSCLMALYLNEHLYSNRSLYSIIINDDSYNTKYVLACLNSSLLQFYYQVQFKADTELFPKIRIAQAKLLPIPTATPEQQQPIIDLVDAILAAKSENPQADTTDLERQIDQLVYQLYELTSEEIALIEQ